MFHHIFTFTAACLSHSDSDYRSS